MSQAHQGRRFRFSLRTLLIAMTLSAVMMAMFARHQYLTSRQREGMKGLMAVVDWRYHLRHVNRLAPEWLISSLGIDHFGTVEGIEFKNYDSIAADEPLPDEVFESAVDDVEMLPDLKVIALPEQVAPPHIVAMFRKRFPNLRVYRGCLDWVDGHIAIALPETTIVGQAAAVTVLVKDDRGYSSHGIPPYRVTAKLTSSDEQAKIPQTAELVCGAAMIEVTFRSLGRQTLVIAVGEDSMPRGTATTNVVAAPAER